MSKDEPALGRVVYRAVQIQRQVVIHARGNTPTPGYRVWLEQLPLAVSPPIHALCWESPRESAPGVMTPFRVHTSFDTPHKLLLVEVIDSHGRYALAVEQAPESLVS